MYTFCKARVEYQSPSAEVIQQKSLLANPYELKIFFFTHFRSLIGLLWKVLQTMEDFKWIFFVLNAHTLIILVTLSEFFIESL